MGKTESLNTQKHVHLIGIGGIAMSALARWFLSQNWAVSGSDITGSQLTDDLTKEGVEVKIGPQNGTSLPPQIDLAVRSQAVENTNKEYLAVKARKIQSYTYPEMIGILTREHDTIAVSGAHGKSTTTALVALILIEAELDPTVVIGTKLKELGGKNFRIGKKSRYLVLEADEYGKAFHNYSPLVAAVTNIDAEHLDTYKNLVGVKRGFVKYFSNIMPGGAFVLNQDDANLYSLAEDIESIAQTKDVTVIWYSSLGEQDGDIELVRKIKKVIKIPGAHNVSNALAAVHVGLYLNIPLATCLAAIGKYNGAWRRMEYRGELTVPGSEADGDSSVPVYDDYGHHPTEIRATLQGFREKFPHHRLICVFQPHQAKRLQALFDDFAGSFDESDTTLIMPLYKVPGRDEKEPAKYSSKALAEKMQKMNPEKAIFYLEKPENVRKAMDTLLSSPIVCGPDAVGQAPKKKAVIVMMGAGNIVEYTGLLLD
jgi:UDP-N-acetylmuramate--alanine ligase